MTDVENENAAETEAPREPEAGGEWEPDESLSHEARKHQDRLTAAVLRSRRVASHSLCQDEDQLLAWRQQTAELVVRGGKVVRMRRSYPPVEPLESLAARCRPFLLDRDSVHYLSVLKSLMFFAKGRVEVQQLVKGLREEWSKGVRRTNDDPLGAYTRQQREDGSWSDRTTTKDLAYGWLYGDLVHADAQERLAVEEYDLTQRYFAGADLVTHLAFCIIALSKLLEACADEGVIPVAASLFQQPTEPGTEMDVEVTACATAPTGTPLDVVEATLDSWIERESEG